MSVKNEKPFPPELETTDWLYKKIEQTKYLIIKPTESGMRKGWHPVGWLLKGEEIMFGIVDLGKDESEQESKLQIYIEKLRAQQLSIGNSDFVINDQRQTLESASADVHFSSASSKEAVSK
jgi:hypothetical protein